MDNQVQVIEEPLGPFDINYLIAQLREETQRTLIGVSQEELIRKLLYLVIEKEQEERLDFQLINRQADVINQRSQRIGAQEASIAQLNGIIVAQQQTIRAKTDTTNHLYNIIAERNQLINRLNRRLARLKQVHDENAQWSRWSHQVFNAKIRWMYSYCYVTRKATNDEKKLLKKKISRLQVLNEKMKTPRRSPRFLGKKLASEISQFESRKHLPSLGPFFDKDLTTSTHMTVGTRVISMDHSNCNQRLKEILRIRNETIAELNNVIETQAESLDYQQLIISRLQEANLKLTDALETREQNEEKWRQIVDIKNRQERDYLRNQIQQSRHTGSIRSNEKEPENFKIEKNRGQENPSNSAKRPPDNPNAQNETTENQVSMKPQQQTGAVQSSTGTSNPPKNSKSSDSSTKAPQKATSEGTTPKNSRQPVYFPVGGKKPIKFVLPPKTFDEPSPSSSKPEEDTRHEKKYNQQKPQYKKEKKQSPKQEESSDDDPLYDKKANNQENMTYWGGYHSSDIESCEDDEGPPREGRAFQYVPFEPRVGRNWESYFAPRPPEMEASYQRCLEIERIELERLEALKPKLSQREQDLARKQELVKASDPLLLKLGIASKNFVEKSRVELKELNERMAREDEEERQRKLAAENGTPS